MSIIYIVVEEEEYEYHGSSFAIRGAFSTPEAAEDLQVELSVAEAMRKDFDSKCSYWIEEITLYTRKNPRKEETNE